MARLCTACGREVPWAAFCPNCSQAIVDQLPASFRTSPGNVKQGSMSNSFLRGSLSDISYRVLWSVAVWSLYGLALITPAIKVDKGGHACTAISLGTLPGLGALLLGWIPPLCIPWSANLLLLVGWVVLLCGRYRTALLLGVAASLAGLTTLGYWATMQWENLLIGYYLWQASLLLLALGAWNLSRNKEAGVRGELTGKARGHERISGTEFQSILTQPR